MAMIGMDIQGVRSLANQMNSTADEIDGTVKNLTTQLQNTQWQGPDRVKFDGEWNGKAAQNLAAIAQQLRETATHLMQEAAQQETASGS